MWLLLREYVITGKVHNILHVISKFDDTSCQLVFMILHHLICATLAKQSTWTWSHSVYTLPRSPAIDDIASLASSALVNVT